MLYISYYIYILYISIKCSQVPTAIALDLADTQADDPAKSRVTLDVTGMCLFSLRPRKSRRGIL